MKKLLVLLFALIFSLTVINVAFAGILEDPVFDFVYGAFNSQGVVSFSIYTS